jgi:hypothetical protein
MQQQGMQAPADDAAFILVVDSENMENFTVEVNDISMLSPVLREHAVLAVETTEISESTLSDEFSDLIQETVSATGNLPSDFDDATTEAAVEALVKGSGKKKKKIDPRPSSERFQTTQVYRSLAEAGKEDGDIADEIA